LGELPRQEFTVEGMTCQGCARRLQAKLSDLEGVQVAQVDFEGKHATVQGSASRDQLCETVRQAGFETR
jgi:Cu+-exporting ATPase